MVLECVDNYTKNINIIYHPKSIHYQEWKSQQNINPLKHILYIYFFYWFIFYIFCICIFCKIYIYIGYAIIASGHVCVYDCVLRENNSVVNRELSQRQSRWISLWCDYYWSFKCEVCLCAWGPCVNSCGFHHIMCGWLELRKHLASQQVCVCVSVCVVVGQSPQQHQRWALFNSAAGSTSITVTLTHCITRWRQSTSSHQYSEAVARQQDWLWVGYWGNKYHSEAEQTAGCLDEVLDFGPVHQQY